MEERDGTELTDPVRAAERFMQMRDKAQQVVARAVEMRERGEAMRDRAIAMRGRSSQQDVEGDTFARMLRLAGIADAGPWRQPGRPEDTGLSPGPRLVG
ncbi:hypothetical protein [Streptomyces sp. NPDC051214]|uniref:hypothetical protein n=1 Tax=Streptomyces sp. NPDC051214 TaxID=3155282 RepID=UPI0034261723